MPVATAASNAMPRLASRFTRKTAMFGLRAFALATMEAEVRPVRYLAQLVGGADADLEKAVRLLILVIVVIFGRGIVAVD
jgi:hypothetical protein